MKILLPTYSSGEFDNGGIVCAFVDLTPDFARKLLRRGEAFKALAKEDEALVSLVFNDMWVEYLSEDSLPDDFEAPDGLTEVVSNPGEAARTELDFLCVAENGVYFRCAETYSDLSVETEVIPWQIIETVGGEA